MKYLVVNIKTKEVFTLDRRTKPILNKRDFLVKRVRVKEVVLSSNQKRKLSN